MFKQYLWPLSFALISKVIILAGITFVFSHFFSSPRISLNIWQLWNVWDGPHYLSLAQSGYQKTGEQANLIVFLPLLPFLIAVFKSILQIDFLPSAYVVSGFTSILLAVMFYKLVLIDYQSKIANWAVLLLFLFPTAFFLHIPYTESLFILLAVSAFYFVRKRYYWLGFFLVGLANLTRITGLALIPAIMIEVLYLDRKNFIDQSNYQKLGLALSGLMLCSSGFIIYLLFNYLMYGTPFQFTIAETQNWYTSFSPFGSGLKAAYESLFWRTGLEKVMLGYGQIIAFLYGLLISLYVTFRIRVSYGVYMLLALWSVYSMSFWISMPRYTLSLFPGFIALALFSQNKIFRYIWLTVSTSLLIFLSLIFLQYGPVF